MAQIRRPGAKRSPLGSVMGVAGAAGSIAAAPATGGLSLLALPGSLGGLQNKGQAQGLGGRGPKIASPGAAPDALGKLGALGNIAGTASNIKSNIQAKPPASAIDRRTTSAQDFTNLRNIPQNEAVMALGKAEQALNTLDDPLLNQEFRRPLMEAMMVAKQRITAGQDPFQPGF